MMKNSFARSFSLKIEVSNGEILDKVSILKIKLERTTDVQKLSEFHHAVKALRATNEKLWDVEDALRSKEKAKYPFTGRCSRTHDPPSPLHAHRASRAAFLASLAIRGSFFSILKYKGLVRA